VKDPAEGPTMAIASLLPATRQRRRSSAAFEGAASASLAVEGNETG
jgi:hypothetical protein